MTVLTGYLGIALTLGVFAGSMSLNIKSINSLDIYGGYENVDRAAIRAEHHKKKIKAIRIEQERVKQLNCLSEAIWAESRSESLLGQRLVAETILQRVDNKRWPNTICKVVYQPKQFSYVEDINMVKVNKAFLSDKPSKEVLTAIKISLEAIARPKSERIAGVHYHSKAVNPVWNRKKTKAATVENHIFYSD